MQNRERLEDLKYLTPRSKSQKMMTTDFIFIFLSSSKESLQYILYPQKIHILGVAVAVVATTTTNNKFSTKYCLFYCSGIGFFPILLLLPIPIPNRSSYDWFFSFIFAPRRAAPPTHPLRECICCPFHHCRSGFFLSFLNVNPSSKSQNRTTTATMINI